MIVLSPDNLAPSERVIVMKDVHMVICSGLVNYLLLVTRNISSKCSSNSEEKASGLLENPEKMFPLYYI